MSFSPDFRQLSPVHSPFGFPGENIGQQDGFVPKDIINQGPPSNPPPPFIPLKAKGKNGINVKSVNPGSIKFCRYNYTYIWLNNGTSFWSYIIYVGRRSLAGFRWVHRRWVYFVVDLRQIDSFICY